MRGTFLPYPSEQVKTLDYSEDAARKYGHRHGSMLVVLEQKHIDALLSGLMLAFDDGEYSTFVAIRETVDNK